MCVCVFVCMLFTLIVDSHSFFFSNKCIYLYLFILYFVYFIKKKYKRICYICLFDFFFFSSMIVCLCARTCMKFVLLLVILFYCIHNIFMVRLWINTIIIIIRRLPCIHIQSDSVFKCFVFSCLVLLITESLLVKTFPSLRLDRKMLSDWKF